MSIPSSFCHGSRVATPCWGALISSAICLYSWAMPPRDGDEFGFNEGPFTPIFLSVGGDGR